MLTRYITIATTLAALSLVFVLTSCGEDTDDDACVEGAVTCIDDETFTVCEDGAQSEEQTCPTDEACMEMENGSEMCMDPMGM